MMWLSIGGILGGIWLWDELSSSNLFKSGIPIYVKIIGVISILIFFVFIGAGFYLFYAGDEELLRLIVGQGTLLMTFAVFYNIGYLISIWNPIIKDENQEVSKGFKIKKKLSLIVLGIMCIYVISVFIIFQISLIFQYLALGGIGFGLGWIFWEHLKETDVLSGSFHKLLKILSIIFEIPIFILMVLGIITNYFPDIFLTNVILLSYLLLFYLMAAYFIGLMLEIIKK
ncbi:MAG: hypothetical protein ACTSX4_01495 [Candidatus Helarchaeota archaeon]